MFRPDLEPTVDQPTAVEARVTLAQITAHEEATLPEIDTTRVTSLTRNSSRRSSSTLTPMGARRLRNVGSKARSVM